LEEKEGDELTFNSDGPGVFKKFDFFNNGGSRCRFRAYKRNRGWES